MIKKLFIITNERIYENNGKFFCDNIDSKSTPESLNKNFEVNVISRRSNKKRAHQINLIVVYFKSFHNLYYLQNIFFESNYSRYFFN